MARAQTVEQKTTGTKAAKSGAVTTTNHDEIRAWVEVRNGKPAKVSDSDGRKGSGILRIDFGGADEGLMPIGWDEFFRIFDDRGLAFLHEEETTDGKRSFFNKFVSRGD